MLEHAVTYEDEDSQEMLDVAISEMSSAEVACLKEIENQLSPLKQLIRNWTQ
jgi:hypothetical protein